MIRETVKIATLVLALSLFAGCAYNPFVPNNHLTGNPVGAAIGVGVGAGGVAILHGPKPLIPIVGIGGGMLGYYVTTLRYAAGGIIRAGGKVYQVGDLVGIYIPSDILFEPNTCEFLPRAFPVLESVVNVLQRYPNQNIIISGNTSGFYHARWEQRLSESRAKKVAAYLWNNGIVEFKVASNDLRRLTYVGYGDYFPISNNITNKGLRENSRIQIVSYPSGRDLAINPRELTPPVEHYYHGEDDITECDHCGEMAP